MLGIKSNQRLGGCGEEEENMTPEAQRIAIPIRRHIDCVWHECQICMSDHEALANYFEETIGYRTKTDWLGKYRQWLDANNIPAEVNGWASRQAFDPKNVKAFVLHCSE